LSVSVTPDLREKSPQNLRRPAPIPRGAWLGLFIIFCVVYVGSLWTPGLLDDADATHAEAAREMSVTGDFVTLHVNGIRYLEKAPLPYWAAAVAYRIFGENEFSTRLPIALGVLFSMLLLVFWARLAFGTRAAIYSGLFALTAAGIYLFTRIFIPEVLLSLFLFSSLYFFLTALEYRQRWRWYAAYSFLALAVLTKGLVAIVFVGGTIFFYCLASGDWRRWREFRLVTGTLLFLAIASPWHVLAGLRNQGGMDGHGFFWFYFVNEHFLRFLGKRFPKDYNKMPALVYWLAHLVWLFPWSLFLPLAVRDAWKQFRDRSTAPDFAARTRLLCCIYAGLVLVFFAFSTNQEYYTFPAYLPLLMLTAASLARSEERCAEMGRRSGPLVTAGQLVYLLVGLAVSAALFAGLWSSRNLPFVPDIGTVLAHRGVGNYTLSMSHFFDLTAESFAALRLPAAIAALAMLLGPLLAIAFRRKGRSHAATWSIAIAAAAFLLAAHLALDRFGPYLSSKNIAAHIQSELSPGDQVMIYGDQSYGSSLLFYLKRPIYLVNGRSTSMLFGSTFPDAPKIFLDDAALESVWNSGSRIFLFVPPERRQHVESILPGHRYLIVERGEKLVYSNRPDSQ